MGGENEMLIDDLRGLIGASKKDLQVFIITANGQGIPNMFYADQLVAVSGKELVLECSSSSEITANLWENSSIRIVAWSRNKCSGYQLETRLIQKKDISKTNGDPLGKILDNQDSHVRMYLLVEINKIIKIEKISHKKEIIAGPGWIEYSGERIILGTKG
jgi:hypothetical protein